MNRGGFSWNRYFGISKIKSNISKNLGVPLTKTGRQQKMGRLISGGGCLMMAALCLFIPLVLVYFLVFFSSKPI